MGGSRIAQHQRGGDDGVPAHGHAGGLRVEPQQPGLAERGVGILHGGGFEGILQIRHTAYSHGQIRQIAPTRGPMRCRGMVRTVQWAVVSSEHTETIAQRRERFERLAMPAVNALYRQAMKLTNNPEDAQDLVQDTFERGFKAFDSFQPGTNFEAWM